MAISFIQVPQERTPVYNDVIFVVDSDNKGLCKFKYICDVYIDSVKVFRDKKFPDPEYGYGVFNIGRVLENYVSNGLNLNQGIIEPRPENFVMYDVRIGEEYDNSDDCSSSATIYEYLNVSSGHSVVNFTQQYDEFPDYTSDKFNDNSPASPFMTNTKEITIAMNETYYLNTMVDTNSGDNDKFLKVITYGADGKYNGRYYFNFQDVYGINSVVNSLGVGVLNLNKATYSYCNLNPQFGAVINNDVYKYDVCVTEFDGNIEDYINKLTSTQSAFISGWSSNTGIDDSMSVITRIGLTHSGTDYKLKFISNNAGEVSTISSTMSSLSGGFSGFGTTEWEIGFNITSLSYAEVAVKIGNVQSEWISTTGVKFLKLQPTVSDSTGIVTIYGRNIEGHSGYFEIDNLFISLSETDYVGVIQGAAILESTQRITFNIDRCKSKFEPIRFIWLNRLGAYDQFTYKLKHTTRTAITKKSFDKTLGRFIASDNYGYKVGDRGTTTLSVGAKSKTLVNSDWIDDNTAAWLEELYTSPDVFQFENNYCAEFYDTRSYIVFGDGSFDTGFFLVFHKKHEFKAGDKVIIVLDSQFYNSTYNGIHTIQSVTDDYTVKLNSAFGNSSTLEGGVLYRYDDYRLLPLNITSSEYEEKLVANKKLFNNEIEFERAYSKNIQRG